MSKASDDVTEKTIKKLCNCLKTRPKEDDLADDPKNLTLPLFPHQKRALSWLLWREGQKPSGGLLADDMGLGKTLTMISLILKSQELKPDKPKTIRKYNGYYPGGTLIVCPASLLAQWANETEGKTRQGSLSVKIYYGNKRETEAKRLTEYDLVITTYGIIRSENLSDGPVFGLRWRRIILDEAHEIRNHTTVTYEAVCNLEGKSRWALTGTPLHNKESDMYAIASFLEFAPFDDLGVWQELFEDGSTEGQNRLRVVVSSFMLRRTKTEMIEKGIFQNMPEKDKQFVTINLEAKEMDLYQQIYQRSRATFDEQSALGKKGTEKILVLLLRLRQICNHPCLIKEVLLSGDLIDSDPFLDVISEDYRSSKIKILVKLLKEKIDSGDKVVVVSQWTSFLEIVGSHLEEEKIKFASLHGAIKAEERMPIVDKINNPRNKTKVLLLSLKAGGVGLNLVGANHLFLLDLYWNPQMENQAQDRIYRMGQTKPVFIYKFLATGTIEEKIKDLQEQKIKMATTILQGLGNGDALSIEDLKLLFDFA